MTEADLLHALRDCYDPLLKRNIIDLGLLHSIRAERDAEAPGAGVRGLPPKYFVRLTLRAPGSDEARNAQMRSIVENRLAGIEAISRVEIELLPAIFSILSGTR
jgi:metal-sulfur cluster biosynthetic enzyme